ncbi:MAG: fasciclin domain-containing protein [Caldilineaceae bacterium]
MMHFNNRSIALCRTPHVGRSWLLSSLALVFALLAGCMPIQPAAAPKPITLRFAIAAGQGSPRIDNYVQEFITQTYTLAQGAITIEPVWDAGADAPDGLFEAKAIQRVQQGEFELGMAPARAFDMQQITSFQPLQAPFLIANDALAEAVATSDIATKLLDHLAAAGMAGLTLWPEDLRHPFSVVPDKSLLSLQDFAGATIRTPRSALAYQLISALGGTPVYGDSAYQGAESGLQQGGTLTGKPSATGNVTFYPKYEVLFANGAAFTRLTEQQRTILRQAAVATQKKALANRPKEVDAATAYCADGGTIVLASAEQVKAFEQAAQPIFAQLEKDSRNAEIIQAIRDLKTKVTPAPGAAACAPKAAQQSPAPAADKQVWSTGLPPNGVWRVELTTEDFVRLGVLRSVAETEWAGVYTITFQDGKYVMIWEGLQGQSGRCQADYELLKDDIVRLTLTSDPSECSWEHPDDIQWRIDDEGLHLHLVPQNSGFVDVESTAFYEAKPWQKIEQSTTPHSGATAMTDATMARLRLANWVFGSSATDMYVDGQIAFLGKSQRALTQVPMGFLTGFLYLDPGMHHVAVVPTGKGIDQAMIALDVSLAVGHRYTVGVMGQKEDAHFSPLVIDETTALAKVGNSATQNVMIYVNNMLGVDTLDFLEDGVGPSHVPYGGFMVAPIRSGHVNHLVVSVNGKIYPPFNADNIFELPSSDFVFPNSGHFPKGPMQGYDGNTSYSDLNAIDLLKQFSKVPVIWNQGPKLSFDTFLAAVEKAGLGDLLTTGTHLIFAPTDAAFEAMPKEQLADLMADPKALADFLRYHIVEGYYPRGSLSGDVFGLANRTVTNLQGVPLKVAGELFINDITLANTPNLVVVNGTCIVPVTKVLLSPAK